MVSPRAASMLPSASRAALCAEQLPVLQESCDPSSSRGTLRSSWTTEPNWVPSRSTAQKQCASSEHACSAPPKEGPM